MSDVQEEQQPDKQPSGELVAGSQHTVLAAMQVLLAARVPVLLWGDPGTGKTETIERFAARAGWRTTTVVVSLHEPTDFAGLPVRTPDGVVFEPPMWAKEIAASREPQLVFFDEVNTAPPSVQNALMRVILEGRVAALEMGEDVRFVAAANPLEHNIGAWDLSAPLASRFAHLRWPVPLDEWKRGYLSAWPDTGPLDLPADSEPDPKAVAEHKAVQAAFLTARPDLLSAPPRQGIPAGGFPSPRTWDRTARCLAIAQEAAADEETELLVAASLLGTGAAAEYLSFERNLDLPCIDQLLSDPALFASLERSDQQHAALSAIVARASAQPGARLWKKAFKVCIAAARQGAPDIAAASAMRLVDIKPAGIALPAGHDVFADIVASPVADGDIAA
ncbi:AAA family ATPase [Candidatus Poriferisocius sp.]|uniref:AAA family ATPase n=1 Tax=Candidatus Poriferisocius sp. TaxID=3101276 RepID=UPI003B021966